MLRGTTLKVYKYVLKKGAAGIREVQRGLKLSSPTLALYHLHKLEKGGLVKQTMEGYEPDFVVERRSQRMIERVVAEVKATCSVSQSDVDQPNIYVRNLAGGGTAIAGKMLVVPAGADTSIVPFDMGMMFLRSFKCENGDIFWYE